MFKVANFYIQKRDIFYGIPFSLCLLASTFSISITQVSFLICLVFWGIEYIFCKTYDMDNTKEKHHLSESIKYFYMILGAWVLFRLLHVFFTKDFLLELSYIKEVWLLLFVPFILKKIQNEKWFTIALFSLLIGGAATGIYNVYLYLFTDIFDNKFYRAAAFQSTHPLTYANLMGLSLFIGIGFSVWLKVHKKNRLFMISILFSFLILCGFILAYSRGPYLALLITLIIILIFVFKKKFIFFIPIIFILLPLVYQNNQKLQFMVTKLFDRPEHQGSLYERLDIWHAGVLIWLNNSVLGVGNSSYHKEYQKYRSPKAQREARAASHMHNDFLNSLVLYGSIGFSIFLCFYLLPIFAFIKSFCQFNIPPPEIYTLIFFIAGIILFALMGLSQCSFTDEEPQMLFWINIALFYQQYESLLSQKTSNVSSP